jgi:Domain of unknown function (DUF397)
MEITQVAQENSMSLEWRRSTRCDGGQCIEIAFSDATVKMRDSKDPAGSVLDFDRDSWSVFVGSVQAGDFDRS